MKATAANTCGEKRRSSSSWSYGRSTRRRKLSRPRRSCRSTPSCRKIWITACGSRVGWSMASPKLPMKPRICSPLSMVASFRPALAAVPIEIRVQCRPVVTCACLNPEEVPSRPSWELGVQLVDQLLADQLAKKGHYPQRIAFTLSAFATFQDFGVMEAQIFYLLGVRPAWDEQNLVTDVELIPAAELKRPRIDVFIAGMGYYRDLLPTRMRLIDKAARLVAAEKEQDNYVFEHTQQIAKELRDRGLEPDKAERLAKARIFSHPPGQNGSASYYYLVERSGHWDSREELMQAYLAQVQHVYTEGMWGDSAPEAYDRQIQGTEIVLRNWSDRTTSPLSNKYTWYQGGSLAAAVKYLTGKEPEFLLTDVRDADDARMVSSEDALRKDFRVRLFNRKWIEGMMKEGYAGADQISVHVSNALGWKIMRPESVTDDQWAEIVDIYLRDSKQLSIREWFEAENPFAAQELEEVLLETIRKGYWQPEEAVVREIAVAYAQSVADTRRRGRSPRRRQHETRSIRRANALRTRQPGARRATRRIPGESTRAERGCPARSDGRRDRGSTDKSWRTATRAGNTASSLGGCRARIRGRRGTARRGQTAT